MGIDARGLFSFLRVARTWAARNVGISGLGPNPTNPWCQHPSRSPLQKKAEEQPARKYSAVELVHHCFVCGLELAEDKTTEENS